METKSKSWLLAGLILYSAGLFEGSKPALAEPVSENVSYQDGPTVLEGYLAYPAEEGTPERKRPAVLVFHEWKGLNDYARRRARQLAELGYVAFAADMYGKGIYARDHAEAAQFSGALKQDRAFLRERARAAYNLIRNHPLVLPEKIAAIGYCFGGTTVLEMARAGMDLAAVASFHGALETPQPAERGAIKAKVLILHGADDPFVKPEEVRTFEEEMRRANADWQLIQFDGARHSFTVPEAGDDPSKGAAYNADADRKSWQIMTDFFKQVLD